MPLKHLVYRRKVCSTDGAGGVRSESRQVPSVAGAACRTSITPQSLTGGYKCDWQHAINGYFMRFISKIEGANKEVFSSHLLVSRNGGGAF